MARMQQAPSNDSSVHHYGHEFDHLGSINQKLRDLQGFDTLAYELIQNADDAPDATQIVFDVRDDALIVENNGRFSDCGHLTDRRCRWKDDPNHGRHACDFHRFRLISGGGKRDEAGTTGAFGIGFLSVYQITDHPELISAGHHWILDEMADESEDRITGREADDSAQGTRFVLPWAKAPTALRRELSVKEIKDEDIEELFRTLMGAVPLAMPFLRRLTQIEIRRNGITRCEITRDRTPSSITICNGRHAMQYALLEGRFTAEANELRQRYPGLIEQNLEAQIQVAVPIDDTIDGLLYVTLPTKHRTDLPFLVNAEFFPKSDRKGVDFDADTGYQTQWNRAAIGAAASVVARNTIRLRDTLSQERFWELVRDVRNVFKEAEKGHLDTSFRAFWQRLQPRLKDEPVVRTASNGWMKAADTVLLANDEDRDAVPFLEGIALHIVHPQLRSHFSLMRELGAPVLDSARLGEALRKHGYDVERPLRAGEMEQLSPLWRLVGRLMQSQRDALHKEVAQCAILPDIIGRLRHCTNLVVAEDAQTRNLFAALIAPRSFLDTRHASVPGIAGLCQAFSAEHAVRVLESIDVTRLQATFKAGRFDPADILRWFVDHRSSFADDKAFHSRIKALPIFPNTQGKLRPLSRLVRPGGFEHDPLNIVELADMKRLHGCADFLQYLGLQRLSLETYVTDYIQPAFAQTRRNGADREEIVALLSAPRHFHQLRGNEQVQQALSRLALVRCTNGAFNAGLSATFDSDVAQDVLGTTAALVTKSAEHIDQFYRWLGVADGPRVRDVVIRIEGIAREKPDDGAVAIIQKLLRFLGERYKQCNPEDGEYILTRLRSLQWLPAESNHTRWYRGDELYATYQKRLFASQASFLDFAHQQECRDMLQEIGVRLSPNVRLIVAHLLHCACENIVVDANFYEYLNGQLDKLRSEKQLEQLRQSACICVRDGEQPRYIRPQDAFWGKHPFGSHRFTLPDEFNRARDLLKAIGVKDEPDCDDAAAVLREITEPYRQTNDRVSDPDQEVIAACWRRLDAALDDTSGNRVANLLSRFSTERVVPDGFGIVAQPREIYFSDLPDIVERFGENAQRCFIARSADTHRALAKAGVRSLNDHGLTYLTKVSNKRADPALASRLTARIPLLARVLTQQGVSVDEITMTIRGITCVSVDELTVQYAISTPDEPHRTESVMDQALYHREDKTLYAVPGRAAYSWSAIARELARVLVEENYANVASGIAAALRDDSYVDASKELDDLRFPHIHFAEQGRDDVRSQDLRVDGYQDTVEEIAPLAQPESRQESQPPLRDVSTVLARPDLPVTRPFSPSSPATPSVRAGDGQWDEQTRHGVSAPDLEENPAPLPASLPSAPTPRHIVDLRTSNDDRNQRDGIDQESREWQAVATHDVSRRGRRRQRRFQLYSRVIVDSEPKESRAGTADENRLVDEAGIARVVDFEKRAGRHPEEMAHNNPGHDIRSYDIGGNLVRYIEVKSLSGAWENYDAVLSRAQFEHSRKYGNLYWLYVVEFATSSDAYLYRIQNPAEWASHFAFDGGWKAVAEM